ncbi:MAG: DUF6240 domain-containing protein [Lachnospiraceae bacterium]|nr:DUF6240 domain-containing protein [Lachnospiraceae bacterium]
MINTNFNTNDRIKDEIIKDGMQRTQGSEVRNAKNSGFFNDVNDDIFSLGETKDTTKSSVYGKNDDRLNDDKVNEKKEKPDYEVSKESLEEAAKVMTEEDLKLLYDEGFPVEKMTSEALLENLKRIKMQMEMRADFYEAAGTKIKEESQAVKEMAQKSVLNDPRAERIAKRLESADIPVTLELVKSIFETMESFGASKAFALTDSEAQYLVTNKLSATVENITLARSNAKLLDARPEKPLTNETWKQLEPSVTKLLFHAGIKNDKAMMETAKTFIRRDIPLTTDNCVYFAGLKKLKLNEDEILDKIIDAVSIGKQPKDAIFTTLSKSGVKSLVNQVHTLNNDDVLFASNKAVSDDGEYYSKNIELSLTDLINAKAHIQSGDLGAEFKRNIQSLNRQGEAEALNIRTRRQLEEVKARLTFDAGFRLSKQGISVDTEKLTTLVSSLKELEDGMYSSFFKGAGVELSRSSLELLQETTKKVDELKNAPILLVPETKDEYKDISLEELHLKGKELEAIAAEKTNPVYRKFYETYEGVMTTPSHEFGENKKKAFNNIDSLLRTVGAEVTEENARAARMLSYSNKEINQKSIDEIKEYDEKLTYVLENLHPQVTVRMIRDGINPLSETIDDLREKIDAIKEEEGISADEKFSNFLVNLEKNSKISDKERTAYIGIYRALHQIKDNDEIAMGNLMMKNQTMTLANLQKAVKNGLAPRFDTKVDDKFGESLLSQSKREKEENARRVDRMSNGLSENMTDILKKIGDKADNKNKEPFETVDMEKPQAEEIKQKTEEIRQLASEADNPSKFLSDYKIISTVENIGAANALLHGDMSNYKELKRILNEKKNEELPNLFESLNSKEEMQNAVDEFADKTLELKKQMYASSETDSLDIKALKSIDVGIRFMRRLSKREYYQIPIDTGDDILQMNVTVISGGAEKGKVNLTYDSANLGKVTAKVKAGETGIKCLITSDSREGKTTLEERQLNLFAAFNEASVKCEAVYYSTDERGGDTYVFEQDSASEQGSLASNNDLYKIAKTLLLHLKEADGN